MASGERLIFIGGAPRSGTTLMQNMLDCHPAVFGGPEFLSLPEIMALRNRLHEHIGKGFIDQYCTLDDADARIGALVEDLLLPLADRHGSHLLSEKTPENVHVLAELAQVLPRARLIHVVRDPRAVVASMLEVGNRHRRKGLKPAWFTADVNQAVRHLRSCYTGGFRAEREAPERVLTLRYEDLVEAPERETRGMCAFLGLDWASAMLSPGEQKHAGEQAITVNSKELWYDAQAYYRNPDRDSLDKWRKTLRPHEEIEVCKAFRDDANLGRLGYELSLSGLSSRARWGGELLHFAHKARRHGLRKIGRPLQRLKTS